MSSLPPALDFPGMEMEIVAKWKEKETFPTQDKLSLERGDKVRLGKSFMIHPKSPPTYTTITH